MGILTKINLLLLTTILALVATSMLANLFTSQELEYYTLVEEIKTLHTYATEALAFEKNFEKTFSDRELVYDALDKADLYLNKIHTDLLGENASKIKEVSSLLGIFRDSFRKIEGNVRELLSKKEQLNMATVEYSSKYDQVVMRMNKDISAGLITMTDVDTTLLQVLKNDSLSAFTSINRIVLLVNQDLILGNNITRFQNNYERAIRRLEIQQKNISIHVESLEETVYQELSQQLAQTYTEIASLVPELKELYLANRQLSLNLQNHKAEISRITQQITEQSEILRAQKHENTTMLQWLGQGSIMLFLLLGGYFFARSITNPLITLTKGARAVSGGDYSQELDITRHDEIGQLAHDFSHMRENLKKSFELIDEQKVQYQSIFENAIEGIFQSSPDGGFLRVNQALIDILGYPSPEDMIGSISHTREQLYVYPPDYDEFIRLLSTDGFVKGFETRLKREDSGIIPVLINAQAIYDEQRGTYVFQGMIEDISERKRAEEYRSAKDVAEAANKAKSVFLANMNHELRTPLNVMLGFSQLLSHSANLDSEQQEHLRSIRRSGEHLLTLINQVLDLSQIEAGRTTLNPSNFNLHSLLHDVQDMFQLRAEEKHLHLLFEQDASVPGFVRTDEVKLRQVLINLLNNAVKFTEEGEVTVRILDFEAPQAALPNQKFQIKNLKFEISDTGPGIAPEEMDRVFEAFGQTETGRQAQEGTGLGLPISRKFVQLMGGDICVESDVGQGTTFTFDIQTQVVEATDLESRIPTRRVIALEPGQPRYRILVVDDHGINRQLVVRLLQPLKFELREAANGQEAIEIWKTWHPHLIWMDMRMPVLDGYEATKRIKAAEAVTNEELSIKNGRREEETVIIALTASSLKEEHSVILDAGCDDYLRKPFRDAELFKLMSTHIGVKFVYEEGQKAEDRRQKAEEGLRPEALAALPAEWLATLKQGAEEADVELVFEVIEQIRGRDTALADSLARLAKDFEYDEILAVIQG